MTDNNVENESKIKSDKINKQAISGFLWMFSGTGVQAILQFIVLIVLARLIAPEEFGLLSAALVILSFGEIFSMLGIGPAIIQRPKLSNEHIQSGFVIILSLNVFLALIVYFMAPIFAEFFIMDKIELILKVLSISFIIKGFGTLAEFLVQRNLRFRLYSSIQVVSYVMYGISGVVCALLGFEVWALVIAYILQSSTKTILFLYFQSHSKKVSFNIQAAKDLFYFGVGFSIARIANQLALQGDNIVIGRLLGAEVLGLYGRAYQLMVMPANLFGQVMDKVLFPIMSKIQDQQKKIIDTYISGITMTAMMILPISALIIVLAKEIVLFLFGTQWISIVIPLQVLSIGMLFRTSYKISDSLVRAKGAVYKRAVRQIIYAVLVILGSWVGHFWGIIGVSFGVLLAIGINFIMMSHLSIKIINIKWSQFIFAHIRPVIISLAVFLNAYILHEIVLSLRLNPFLSICGVTFFVTLTFILLIWKFPRLILGKQILFFLRDTNLPFISKIGSKS